MSTIIGKTFKKELIDTIKEPKTEVKETIKKTTGRKKDNKDNKED